MNLSKHVLKSAILAALVAVAGHASAIGTASNPVSLGLLGSSDTTFGNSLSGKTGSFTDYFSFSLGGDGNGATGKTVGSTWYSLAVAGVTIKTIELLSSSTLSTGLVDTNPVDGFLFTGLSAGTYTLAVSGDVQYGLFNGKYSGTIHAVSAPVASPAPEAADFAMALVGLVGVGALVRRRAAR